MLVACSAKHGRPPIETNEAGVDAASEASDAHVDAMDDAASNDATLNDAGVDAGPVDCDGGFEALDDTCVVDDDCALVTRARCAFDDAAVSDVMGIARTEHGKFERLAVACNVPMENDDCALGAPFGYAPSHVDEELSDASHGLQAAVRCQAGHCVSHRTSCGPALCGNGVLDSCYVTDSENGPVFASTEYWAGHHPSETCDGAALDDQTCASTGFSGGALACVPGTCLLDYRACQICEAPSASLTGCVSGLGFGAVSPEPVFATRGDELGVAWVALLPNADVQVHFTRFGPGLAQLSDATLPPNATNGHGLQLAPFPGGWVLAARRPIAGVDLHTFAVDGTYAGIARTLDGSDAFLAARPNDAPLLLEQFNGWKTHWLAADLSSIGWPGAIGDGPIASAIWIGDGYLVMQTAFQQPFKLQRVEPNAAVVTAPVTYSVSPIDPVLVYDGTLAAVAYHTPAYEARLQRLANDGQPAAGSPAIPVAVSSNAPIHWAGVGGDVFVAWATPAGLIQVAPVDVTGALGGAIHLASYPSILDSVSVLAQGNHAVIAAHHAPSLQASAYPLPASGWILARIAP